MEILESERKPSRCVCGALLYAGWCGLIESQQLLAHNARVYLAARSAQKANEAIAELQEETGKQAIFLQLDLADIPAVRRSAQEFLSYVPICYLCDFLINAHKQYVFRNESQLHVLINNA